jgi:hypothetical protein
MAAATALPLVCPKQFIAGGAVIEIYMAPHDGGMTATASILLKILFGNNASVDIFVAIAALLSYVAKMPTVIFL